MDFLKTLGIQSINKGVNCIVVDAKSIGLGKSCASTSSLQYEIDTPLFLQQFLIRLYQIPVRLFCPHNPQIRENAFSRKAFVPPCRLLNNRDKIYHLLYSKPSHILWFRFYQNHLHTALQDAGYRLSISCLSPGYQLQNQY